MGEGVSVPSSSQTSRTRLCGMDIHFDVAQDEQSVAVDVDLRRRVSLELTGVGDGAADSPPGF